MTLSSATRWRRACRFISIGLCLGGALAYGVERTYSGFSRRLSLAQTHYQARRYPEAITAYKGVQNLAATLPVRASLLLLDSPVPAGGIALQIANCYYRLAEIELHHYQQATRDPRVTPRPSLETVQRRLTEASQAYAEVPQTDPPTSLAAQVNGARVAAWQLILAAFEEQTTGRRSLRQQALQAIQYAAKAVDYSHLHQERIQRQERMTAMLLLETLTAFSQEPSPPSPPRPPKHVWDGQLGDLLLRDTPELSLEERQRFRQFFFALPLEAKDPWPTDRQEGAGGGRSPIAH